MLALGPHALEHDAGDALRQAKLLDAHRVNRDAIGPFDLRLNDVEHLLLDLVELQLGQVCGNQIAEVVSTNDTLGIPDDLFQLLFGFRHIPVKAFQENPWIRDAPARVNGDHQVFLVFGDGLVELAL